MIDLVVRIKDRYSHKEWAYGQEIQGGFEETFAPLKITDDPALGYVTGDHLAGSVSAQRIVQLRKDTADYLAKAIAEQLLNHMQHEDTINGYPVEREGL